MRRKAFTLIELLVVIAIIAILAAILFPVFAQAREKARQTTCLNNTKQVGTALMQYTQDYDETYPPSRYSDASDSSASRVYNWNLMIQPYAKSAAIFGCPSDPHSINKGRTAPTWCPDSVVTAGPANARLDLFRRSFNALSGTSPGGGGPQADGVMAGSWGAKMAELDRPAGTAVITERWGESNNDALTVCQSGSSTWKGNDAKNYQRMPTVGNLNPQGIVLTATALMQSPLLGGGSDPQLDRSYHSGGFNIVYGDGHAKWSKRQNTFKINAAGLLEWSIWDRRIAP